MYIYKFVDVAGGIRRRPPLHCGGVLHVVLKFREIFEFSLRLFDFGAGFRVHRAHADDRVADDTGTIAIPANVITVPAVPHTLTYRTA